MTDYSFVEELHALPDTECVVVCWVDDGLQETNDESEVYGVVFRDLFVDKLFIINSELLNANEQSGHAIRTGPQ